MGQGAPACQPCDAGKEKVSEIMADLDQMRCGAEDGAGYHPGYQPPPGGCDVHCGVKEHVAAVSALLDCQTPKATDEAMANHQLLQAARQGDPLGVASALECGAWTETRRPLVLKPDAAYRESKAAEDQIVEGQKASRQSKKEKKKNGMTSMMFAAQNGSVECLRLLLNARAKINAVDEDGWTPLHFAAKEWNVEASGLLIERGADASLVIVEGKNCFDLAAEEDPDFSKRLKALYESSLSKGQGDAQSAAT